MDLEKVQKMSHSEDRISLAELKCMLLRGWLSKK